MNIKKILKYFTIILFIIIFIIYGIKINKENFVAPIYVGQFPTKCPGCYNSGHYYNPDLDGMDKNGDGIIDHPMLLTSSITTTRNAFGTGLRTHQSNTTPHPNSGSNTTPHPNSASNTNLHTTTKPPGIQPPGIQLPYTYHLPKYIPPDP